MVPSGRTTSWTRLAEPLVSTTRMRQRWPTAPTRARQSISAAPTIDEVTPVGPKAIAGQGVGLLRRWATTLAVPRLSPLPAPSRTRIVWVPLLVSAQVISSPKVLAQTVVPSARKTSVTGFQAPLWWIARIRI